MQRFYVRARQHFPATLKCIWLGMLVTASQLALSQTTKPSAPRFDLLTTTAVAAPRAAKSQLTAVGRAGKRIIAAGGRGVVVYSDDGGKAWSQANVPTMVSLTGVHFPTAEKGWGVGHDGVVLQSLDGGKSWTKQIDGNDINSQVVSLAKLELQKAQAAYDSNKSSRITQDALDRALDFMGVADSGAKYGPSRPLLDVWFKNESEGWVVGAFGVILRTQDGGKKWRLYSAKIPNEQSLHLYSITATASGTLLVAAEQGYVFRSEDSGETWTRSPSLSKGGLFGIVTASHLGREIAIAFGLNGNVFRSEDAGKTWIKVALNSTASFWGGHVLSDGTILLVGNDSTVASSSDGGLTFAVASGVRGVAFNAIVSNGIGDTIAVGPRGITALSGSAAEKGRN